MKVEFTIDGKNVSGEEGQTILDVARANDINIPALCNHDAVSGWGGCRLCIVEITMDEWKGSSKIVTSCLYPAKKGLIVDTMSDRVIENRKMILNLLMARAPGAVRIKKLANEYGLAKTDLVAGNKGDRCIMCALCTRLCAHQNIYAISTVHRGPDKEIGTYWRNPPEECIGCLICAKNCPTDAIPFEETHSSRKIWGRDFELAKCPDCGGRTALTPEQALFYAKSSGLGAGAFARCDKCNRNETAKIFMKLIQDTSADLMDKWGSESEKVKMPRPPKGWIKQKII